MKMMHIFIMGFVIILSSSALANPDNLVAWWKFDTERKDIVKESIQGVSDSLYGYQKYVSGVSGKALLFDGYTSFIKKSASTGPAITEAFTVEAWIAFQAYPWNWVAIVDQLADSIRERKGSA